MAYADPYTQQIFKDCMVNGDGDFSSHYDNGLIVYDGIHASYSESMGPTEANEKVPDASPLDIQAQEGFPGPDDEEQTLPEKTKPRQRSSEAMKTVPGAWPSENQAPQTHPKQDFRSMAEKIDEFQKAYRKIRKNFKKLAKGLEKSKKPYAGRKAAKLRREINILEEMAVTFVSYFEDEATSGESDEEFEGSQGVNDVEEIDEDEEVEEEAEPMVRPDYWAMAGRLHDDAWPQARNLKRKTPDEEDDDDDEAPARKRRQTSDVVLQAPQQPKRWFRSVEDAAPPAPATPQPAPAVNDAAEAFPTYEELLALKGQDIALSSRLALVVAYLQEENIVGAAGFDGFGYDICGREVWEERKGYYSESLSELEPTMDLKWAIWHLWEVVKMTAGQLETSVQNLETQLEEDGTPDAEADGETDGEGAIGVANGVANGET